MTAEVMTDWTVTAPGVVVGMPASTYHADPVPGGSLSVSGARMLLPPSCPAIFAWERRNPPPSRDVFDIGQAAHTLVLGDGAELVVVEADDWRSKAAQEQKKAAYATGATPLLRCDYDRVVGMADALRRHPVAATLLSDGKPEVSAFWQDDEFGVWRRARFDWLPRPVDGRMIVVDYKTTSSASPTEFGSSAAKFGYHQQAAWYLDAVYALDLADEVAFTFIAQQKVAPYLVSVVELDATALAIGRSLNRQALAVYADCTATGEWPGYPNDIVTISLPAWYERRHGTDAA